MNNEFRVVKISDRPRSDKCPSFDPLFEALKTVGMDEEVAFSIPQFTACRTQNRLHLLAKKRGIAIKTSISPDANNVCPPESSKVIRGPGILMIWYQLWLLLFVISLRVEAFAVHMR